MTCTWLVAHDFAPSADAAAHLAARDLLEGKSAATIVLCHVYTIMPLPLGMEGGVGGGVRWGSAAMVSVYFLS